MKKCFLLVLFFCIWMFSACGDEEFEITEPMTRPVSCGKGTIQYGNYCILDSSICSDRGMHWENKKCVADTYVCEPSQEICDGKDNDCDGEIDEDFSIGKICNGTFGVCQTKGTFECSPLSAKVICSVDVGGSESKAGLEICNDGIDNNCNGEIDEMCIKCYPDSDQDGYITEYAKNKLGVFIQAKDCPPTFILEKNLLNEFDCNDSYANANPNEKEICDGIDNNCNGEIDEDDSRWGEDCTTFITPFLDGVYMAPDIFSQGKLVCTDKKPVNPIQKYNYMCILDIQPFEVCDDLRDNDGDWMIDGEDRDCF